MPNNRPTTCAADRQNCVALARRSHFDGAVATIGPTRQRSPQGLDDRVNLRRARIGVFGSCANVSTPSRKPELG